jgi:processive 1,2-diacylglycerol beta-glucosyltransferase
MKKITIFSSSGGGGHTAVAHALNEYLKETYRVETSNVFSHMLKALDPAQTFSAGKYNGEDIYNFCMANKWYKFLNLYYKLGSTYYRLFNKKINQILHEYLDEAKPDFIISVAPLINHIILRVAQERNIPFLLVPTDLDIATFITGIKNPTYNKFKIATAYDTQRIEAVAAKAHIPLSCFERTGFAIRADFFEKKDHTFIKATYGIDENRPVVLLLLGAVGLKALYDFVAELTNVKTEAHILICIGRQEELRDKINALNFPPHLSKTIIGFTSRMSDLMAISDLLITKSGSVSVSEGIYMNLPMILDATTSLLRWEAYNHQFIQEHNFGTTINQLDNLAALVTHLLYTKKELELYKKSLTAFNKKHGGTEIKKVVEKILELELNPGVELVRSVTKA